MAKYYRKLVRDGRVVAQTKPLDPVIESALTENRRQFLNFVARRLGDGDEAEDVLHDFYFRAIKKSASVRCNENIVGWLYRVLYSTLVDHQRRKKRHRQLDRAYADQVQIWEPGMDVYAKVCVCIYQRLPLLSRRQADLIWKIDLLGEGRGNIAAMFGITANALSARIHRARQALKDALLSTCETCPVYGFDDCGCKIGI